jgi:hypothetical protein
MCIVAGYRDGIATHSADNRRRLAQVAEHRNAIDDRPRQLRGWQADADNLHASVRLAPNPLAELLRRSEAADYKHMPQAASAALKLMKHLSGEETNNQAQQHCKRRAGRNELQDGVEL